MAERISEIWDDESGTPPPMTAAEQDERLHAANERKEQENAVITARLAELESLAEQKEQLLLRLQTFLQDTERERKAIRDREKILTKAASRTRRSTSAKTPA